jgi:hypothetical protein
MRICRALKEKLLMLIRPHTLRISEIDLGWQLHFRHTKSCQTARQRMRRKGKDVQN